MEFKMYRGRKGIMDLMNLFSRIQKAGDVTFSFGYEGGFDRALGKGWWKEFTHVKSAKTRFKGVFSMHRKARKLRTKRTEIRYVDAGKGEIEVAVWKDTVRIFVLTRKDPYAIFIKDPVFAKGLMGYWKFLHSKGKAKGK